MRVHYIPFIFAFSNLGFADELHKDQYCFDAIYEIISDLSFVGSSPKDRWGSNCRNPLKVGSIYAAGSRYCTEYEIKAGTKYLAELCEERGKIELLPISQFHDNLTAEYLRGMRVIDQGEVSAKKNLTTTVMISPAYFDIAYRTVATWEFETWSHHTYGFAMYGFWGSILVLGMLANAYNALWIARQSYVAADVEGSTAISRPPTWLQGPIHWIRTNVIIPSCFGTYRRRLYFGFSVSTRSEALIIGAYWSLSLILCAVNIRTFEGNIFWEKTPPQVWRYVTDRAGVMAYSNLPILWMFSGRNNIFMWATGWNYASFNVFHRHIARVATLEAIVHAIAYTVIYKDRGTYEKSLAEPWFYLGITAVVTMSSLLIFSSIWLRKKFYEVFLLLHIALSLLAVVSLFYHTSKFDGEYDPYLWPIVAIWSFDRFLRFVRLAWCNCRLSFSKKVLSISTSVTTYNKEADVIKIAVSSAHKLLKLKPGQFYYIYRPLSWKGWESHPFTLGSYTRAGQITRPYENVHLEKEKDMIITETVVPETPTSRSDWSTESQSNEAGRAYELVFWLRPFNGWTSRLRDRCQRSADGTLRSHNILIEGPYGHSANLHLYESIVLIAGGTGISSALPYIEEHIHRHTRNIGSKESKSSTVLRTREINLVWTCKQSEMIHDVCEKELRPAISREDIHMQFFSTYSSQLKSESIDIEKITPGNSSRIDIEITPRRPNITTTILEAARVNISGGSKAGRLAILVCGPAAMADEARAAVHRAMKEGCRSIEYIEETFGW